MNLKLGWILPVLATMLLALAVEADAPPPAEETVSKAVVLESADFLKAPAGLDQSTFTVAKTAPQVDVCFFAGLKNRGKGTLWSSWGDGCLASNGKYYTSIGDHLGVDATSYVYEYDPVTRVLKRVIDVLQAIGQMLGLFGHGKIHSGIHEAEDGWLYFSTYWGKQNEVEKAYAKGYPGSLLLRFDPKSGKTENLGAIVPKQGLPTSRFDAQRQLLYFFAVYKGDVAVYDLKSRQVKFKGGADITAGHRAFMTDAASRVYFTAAEGQLHYYDPQKNQLGQTKVSLPSTPGGKKGNTLRAAAPRPTKKGILYGMTAAGQMFAFDPTQESIKDLGANFAGGHYTAVMALSSDEKYLYFAPGAHGGGAKVGVPVVQYDLASGQRKVLAFLQQPMRDKFNYQLGGTYNLQMDAKGERLFITFNGAPAGARGQFGQPVVTVLHIPASERP